MCINLEVTTVKGRDYPFSASSVGDRQNFWLEFPFSVDMWQVSESLTFLLCSDSLPSELSSRICTQVWEMHRDQLLQKGQLKWATQPSCQSITWWLNEMRLMIWCFSCRLDEGLKQALGCKGCIRCPWNNDPPVSFTRTRIMHFDFCTWNLIQITKWRGKIFNWLQGLAQFVWKCLFVYVWMHKRTQFFLFPFWVLVTYLHYHHRRRGSLFETESHIREYLQLVFISKCCYVYISFKCSSTDLETLLWA